MPSKIVLPTQRELDAQKSLQTFFTYISAWRLLVPDWNTLSKNQEALDSFKKLQGGVSAREVQGPYLRGALTLKLMKQLPLGTHPDLAGSANYWAPVQAYYAAHGFGLAIIHALESGKPKDHRHFRSLSSAQVMGRLLPFPYNMLCIGNPWDTTECSVENCPNKTKEISSFNNLSKLTTTNAPLLAGKSLMTTRKGALDDLFDKHRNDVRKKEKSRRNLKPTDKQRLMANLHGTSFLDLLYRMRVRSNYDDPEMFIFGQLGGATAVEHYRNLVTLVDAFSSLAGNIVRMKIGRVAFDALVATIPQEGGKNHGDHTSSQSLH